MNSCILKILIQTSPAEALAKVSNLPSPFGLRQVTLATEQLQANPFISFIPVQTIATEQQNHALDFLAEQYASLRLRDSIKKKQQRERKKQKQSGETVKNPPPTLPGGESIR